MYKTKSIIKYVIALTLISGANAFAGSVDLVVDGHGGTTHGDQRAACQRANERAMRQLFQDCDRFHGRLSPVQKSPCTCRREPGSRDDFDCHIRAHAVCRFPGPRPRP